MTRKKGLTECSLVFRCKVDFVNLPSSVTTVLPSLFDNARNVQEMAMHLSLMALASMYQSLIHLAQAF